MIVALICIMSVCLIAYNTFLGQKWTARDCVPGIILGLMLAVVPILIIGMIKSPPSVQTIPIRCLEYSTNYFYQLPNNTEMYPIINPKFGPINIKQITTRETLDELKWLVWPINFKDKFVEIIINPNKMELLTNG